MLADVWPYLSSAFVLGLALVASAHAILHKRDATATLGWVGVIWMVPIAGALLYASFGINRIRRRAAMLRRGRRLFYLPSLAEPLTPKEVQEFLPEEDSHLAELARLGETVAGRPLLPANRITSLVDGDVAYPAMIEAIEQATQSVTLATYIFDTDAWGLRFVDALEAAKDRGVEVRVLVDDAGKRYARPHVDTLLERRGVPCASFMPARLIRMPYLNLRNHRKILVIDGRLAFMGGMNIRGDCVLGDRPKHPTHDTHFRVEGPVVRQVQEVFAEDWQFATRESLEGTVFFPEIEPAGETLCRVFTDGPDIDMDKIRWIMAGAINSAERSIRIVTPYFLPDRSLETALEVAALRGVEVDIVVPEHGNLAIIRWAMNAQLSIFTRGHCRVWVSPAPFDHSKLMVVDQRWSFVGSANWDPRSLRLNFEVNLECFSHELAREIDGLVEERILGARELSRAELDRRSLARRLRDGIARLFSPYL
ncbi:MAG: cardiolipin synthase [Deltaproteobacteria bacterium]|nr:cardiolipin synthase [Deltaproteobacteria bacterium]